VNDERRKADLELFVGALRLAFDRSLPFRLRFKARTVAAAFRLRLALRWHSRPAPWFRFRFHGRHCGPGISSEQEPIDKLDALCKAHDESPGYGST